MAEYIDRDAVYTAFANACTDVLERASEIYYIAGFSYEHVIEILDEIPVADVAPVRHGRWTAVEEHIYLTDGVCKEWTNFYCSICDTPNNSPTNYCPNCGTKMDEVSE